MNLTDEQIIETARAAHNANRILCKALGDTSQSDWEDAPEWQQESAIKGVLAIIKGVVSTPIQAHKEWLAEKKKDGWVYGTTKDPDAKTHPCMVEYEELPPAQRAKDDMFLFVVTSRLELIRALW